MIFRTSIYSFLLIALSILGAGDVAHAQEGKTVSPSETGLLVDADWVMKHRTGNLRIISLGQSLKQYREGHIVNAVFVDWKTQIADSVRKDLFNLPERAVVEKLLSEVGVAPDTTIVIADTRSNRLSTRLFWTLKMHGHKNLKILDGGKEAWKKAGKALTTNETSVIPTDYKFATDNKTWADANFADTDKVRDSIQAGAVLVDGRPAAQYTGAEPGVVYHTKKPHKRYGHIETAINVPWKMNFTKDGKFKSVEALRALYAEAGVTPDKPVVTYCNEGLHAAPAWFVLKEVLGYPEVRLYDDSMGLWANRPDTPMTKLEEKKK